jgi:hypothetical protein
MANFLEVITLFLKECIGNPDVPPKLPTVLRDAGITVEKLLTLSLGSGASGIQEWIRNFEGLISSPEIRDALMVRALQIRFPRLAETLTFLGVITFDFEPNGTGVRSLKLDWDRLNRFISDPSRYATDRTNGALGLLLSKIEKIEDVKAIC